MRKAGRLCASGDQASRNRHSETSTVGRCMRKPSVALYSSVIALAKDRGADRVGGWMPSDAVTRELFEVTDRVKELTMVKPLVDRIKIDERHCRAASTSTRSTTFNATFRLRRRPTQPRPTEIRALFGLSKPSCSPFAGSLQSPTLWIGQGWSVHVSRFSNTSFWRSDHSGSASAAPSSGCTCMSRGPSGRLPRGSERLRLLVDGASHS